MLDRWLELCKHIDVKGGPGYHAQLYRRLVHYYNQPWRYYHTLVHIDNCLTKFDEIRHLLKDPDSVELAIWFHDAIYEFWADDNEGMSASLAIFFLVQLMGLPKKSANRVAYLIERTKHFSKDKERYEPTTNDAKFMVDIDLHSGLGGDWQCFQKNWELNNGEFNWKDKNELMRGQLGMFTNFHRRAPLYKTDYFRERYEERTKQNIERAIKKLEEQLLPPKALSNQELPQGVNPDFVKLVDGIYYDLCVVCKADTSIRTDCPVEHRMYYVEGGGQLCKECYEASFSKK